jgi:hypothetical protein
MLSASICYASDSEVQSIGIYSDADARGPGGVTEGFYVRIWKYKEQLLGEVEYYPPGCRGPSRGLLEDIRVEKAKGSEMEGAYDTITFKAHINLCKPGTHVLAKPNLAPMVVHFRCEMWPVNWPGLITWYESDGKKELSSEKIDLWRQDGVSFETLGKWKEWERNRQVTVP